MARFYFYTGNRGSLDCGIVLNAMEEHVLTSCENQHSYSGRQQ